MQATLVCPDVRPHLQLKDYSLVRWNRDSTISEGINAIRRKVNAILHDHQGLHKEMSGLLSNCVHVYCELGSDAFWNYLQVGLDEARKAMIGQMEQISVSATKRFARSLKSQAPAMILAIHIGAPITI
eukprot:GHVN01037514.1.p1 GENE.GHVN01037514.1~~GHVN01037514.1.p1  ORF type:complete len:128 (+),score=6.38 GHVN01037514.1:164-547(+)